MGTEDDFGVVQTGKLVVVNHHKAHIGQAVHLDWIVNHRTQTVERLAVGQFGGGFGHSVFHPEAESRFGIDGNLKRFAVAIAHRPSMIL